MPYSTNEYLLDRINIQDVVTNMYMHFDRRNFENLVSDVFAADMIVDYTGLQGGDPSKMTNQELVDGWKRLASTVKASQHSLTGIIPDLPQPGSELVPTTTKVVSNGAVLLKSLKDNIIENKGRMYFDLIRLEVASGNPWRITGLRVDLVWESCSIAKLSEDAKDLAFGGGSD